MQNNNPVVRTFETLFKNNYAKLCHFALQFLKDKEQSKDIVQEVFISLLKIKENDLDKDLPETAFLYTAVRNACLNKLRRNKLESNYLNHQKKDPFEDAVALNQIIKSEVISELHKVISTLPKNCQQVFKMGYLENLKNPQIAEQLGISVNTVKTHKKRGLEILRMRFNNDSFSLLIIIHVLFKLK